MLYAGEFFPDPDRIVEMIDRKRQRCAEEKQDNKTSAEYQENWNQIERFMDAHDGKTPQQLWCEENQALIASLNEKLVTSKTGKAE